MMRDELYNIILQKLVEAIEQATIEDIPLDRLIRAYAQLKALDKNSSDTTITVLYEALDTADEQKKTSK